MDTGNFNLLEHMLSNGLLIETGVDGLYGRESGMFEDVVSGIENSVIAFGGGAMTIPRLCASRPA